MIVRAALAALACLAARVAGQTKQCDPSIPDIIFRRKQLDAASSGVAVLAADLNGDSDVDIAAAFYLQDELLVLSNDFSQRPIWYRRSSEILKFHFPISFADFRSVEYQSDSISQAWPAPLIFH